MTRSELIQKIVERFPQLTLEDAELSAKNILDAMSNSLASGGRVEVRGFGTFGLNHKPPRIGRNPKTGEKVNVPERYTPHFKAGTLLRDIVNK